MGEYYSSTQSQNIKITQSYIDNIGTNCAALEKDFFVDFSKFISGGDLFTDFVSLCLLFFVWLTKKSNCLIKTNSEHGPQCNLQGLTNLLSVIHLESVNGHVQTGRYEQNTDAIKG